MEGKQWDACISYFISLRNFYVQDSKDKQTIHQILTSLQLLEGDELSTLHCAKPGDLVAAKYENDGLWYRAKILDTEKNVFTVKFIDYGSSQTLSNIKKLPKELAGYYALAHHCTLDDVDDVEEHIVTTNFDIYNIFFEFITSVELNVTFLNDKEPYVVKIKWDNRNIKTILNNIISSGNIPEIYETLKKNYQAGSKFQVNLINIVSINEFYVESRNSNETRKKIEYEFENNTVWELVTEFKIGKIAIALCSTDNCWYTVRILKIPEEGKCKCYLIDYGVQENCTHFYEAVGYLKSAPPIIIRCSLHMPNIKNKNKMFNSLSRSFVDEMAKCINQELFITIVESGEPFIVDLEVDNLNMAKVIEPKSVVIIHVYNFNLLLVQINSHGRLAVMNELSNIKTQLSPVKKPKINRIYGAYLDEQWYRVQLISIFNKKLMVVIQVDMGSLKVLAKELFYLPPHIENIEYLSIYCVLDEFDKQHCNLNKLREISDDGRTTFTMIVLQHNEIDGHCIQLFLGDQDVSKIIRED